VVLSQGRKPPSPVEKRLTRAGVDTVNRRMYASNVAQSPVTTLSYPGTPFQKMFNMKT
jgi:hypothetical protein